MILVDKTILSEIDKGNIKVVPFNREYLGTNSIDLTLNPEILVYRNDVLDCKSINTTKPITIPNEGMVLMPGQLYIASTNEYTETLNAVPKLEGKSSLGRLGLFIHVTAGYGDVGFKGTWTLELFWLNVWYHKFINIKMKNNVTIPIPRYPTVFVIPLFISEFISLRFALCSIAILCFANCCLLV